MKITSILSTVAVAASVVSAGPILAKRSVETRTELDDGDEASCPKVILIYGRGSTEVGNMGEFDAPGPILAAALEGLFDSIWIQGIGGAYTASVAANLLPKGTTNAAIAEAKRLYTLAHTKCPNSAVVTGGYSQGAALVAASLSELAGTAVQEQVKGAVLFGYTKNKQNGGRIPNYPTERTAIYCEKNDAVCFGTLFVLPDHFQYGDEAAEEAPAFLASLVG
ncbi:related to Cutinase 1 [Cephalotrichum gorgonifer]|uniref:Cutinase n=1 Tax=Cephalotrichum gorgonifer TaxID=2041049 RepID=A0AAE8SUJ1_9PEZI|nr:related to Cutinase 1 [Cephalotrichum gorgonifer]